MEEKLTNEDAIDLGVALMMVHKNEKKMISLRLEILHILDKYSKLNTSILLYDAKRFERYILTGDTSLIRETT